MIQQPKEQQATLAVLGMGHMGAGLMRGLIAQGYRQDFLYGCDIAAEVLAPFAKNSDIHTSTELRVGVEAADIVILAVKPHVIPLVLEPLKSLFRADQLLISVAAGVETEQLAACLDEPTAIIRCMPNTPAIVQAGMMVLYAMPGVSKNWQEQAESIMRTLGAVHWVEHEEKMHAVTAISGSGPAYFFRVMEALQQAGVAQGLTTEEAQLLVVQTAFGAAKLALEDSVSLSTLREQVTSPGGTTEQGLLALESGGVEALFEAVVAAAAQRSKELAHA